MSTHANTSDQAMPRRFAATVATFHSAKPILVLTHNDADGLSAGALLLRAFAQTGRPATVRVVGRGENPWSDAMRAEVATADPGGLIVADLGIRAGDLRAGVPTVIIDHHVPTGTPGNALVLSGFGADPVPTASLLAYRCAAALTDASPWLWLAAVGLVGDLGDKAPFAELTEAKAAYTASALKELVSLVNAPRRTADGDASPALSLLMQAESPKDAIGGRWPEVARLRAAREEVKAALDAGKRMAPRVRGDIALITLDSPCQIHPLVAQSWRMRLKDKLVIAANHGYRPGWVHFALRSATGRDLIAFLREHAPPGADENYGGGHIQATGGALRLADWAVFLTGLGFPADVAVAA